jgi:hypothetical protein
MQQTIIIDDVLLKNATHCLAIDDINEVISVALRELIKNHPVIPQKRHQPEGQCNFSDGICGSPNTKTRKVLDNARLNIDVYTATDINDLFQQLNL